MSSATRPAAFWPRQMPATVELTVGHLQAAIIVCVGFCATEHYRLIEILTDLTRFATWSGKLFLLSLIVYTAAFTYCATDLNLRLAQLTFHHDCECPECATQLEREHSPCDVSLADSAITQGLTQGKNTPPRLFTHGLPLTRGSAMSNARILVQDKSTSLATQISSTGAAEDDDDGLSPLLIPHCRPEPVEESSPPAPRPQSTTQCGYTPQDMELLAPAFLRASMPTGRRMTEGDRLNNPLGSRSILKPSGARPRRVSVLDYKEKKGSISVAFARIKKGNATAFGRMYRTLDEVDYDLINCKTLSLNIYIPLILGHASTFVVVAYAMATYPVYGYAATPLLILAYAGLMNANSLMRHLVPRPTERWLCVTCIFLGLYYYRLRNAKAAPLQFSAATGDLWSMLLIFIGTMLFAFYLAFALGCSVQSAMRHSTLQDWCGRICSNFMCQ